MQMASAVESTRELMRAQLIAQLYTTITLAQCLKCVQHLRALNVYTDMHLRYIFLQVGTNTRTYIVRHCIAGT